jgi:transposase
MYFKVSIRVNPATDKPDGYYRLIESYRNFDGRVCHRTLLHIGFMTGVAGEDLNRIQRLLNHRRQFSGKELFAVEYETESPLVQRWFNELYARLVNEKKIDVSHVPTSSSGCEAECSDWQTIDMNSLRNKDIREIGGEWLCYQSLSQLGLDRFLFGQSDWSVDDVRLALTHIISRAVYPASEYKTSRWIRENSAVCEVTGFPIEKINKDRLYGISRRLYALKDRLESFLSSRTNELFDINDKIILYDLTNTYFEGTKRGSDLARFGRSKEKRSDCKLVVLALVINQFGFIKYSSVLQGNVSEPSTLDAMLKDLRSKTSGSAKTALVVLDAGLATEENLAKIRSAGYHYLCVRRSLLKDYEMVADSTTLRVEDNCKRKIQLQKVSPVNASIAGGDYYLKVESEQKRMKEVSMNDRFRDGYLNGLQSIQASLSKKRGTKIEGKVRERVGRLIQKYPSIHKYYQVDYQVEEKVRGKKQQTTERIVTSMTWTLKQGTNMYTDCGVYFLRTSLDNEDRILWDSYNIIREIEYTMRVLKTDLDMRPIFHQKDETTMAHLHLALLAYWIVNTIRYQLKEEGINYGWSEVIRIMNTQKAVTTTVQNNCEQIIQIRRCSEPNEKVRHIYQTLKYKSAPFKKKKVVVHKCELEKVENFYLLNFNSG